jgi:hypothetical protein
VSAWSDTDFFQLLGVVSARQANGYSYVRTSSGLKRTTFPGTGILAKLTDDEEAEVLAYSQENNPRDVGRAKVEEPGKTAMREDPLPWRSQAVCGDFQSGCIR